jgi:hypothetical protein
LLVLQSTNKGEKRAMHKLPIAKDRDAGNGEMPPMGGRVMEERVMFRDSTLDRGEPWHRHPVFVALLTIVLPMIVAAVVSFLTMRQQLIAQEKLSEERRAEQSRINTQLTNDVSRIDAAQRETDRQLAATVAELKGLVSRFEDALIRYEKSQRK